MNDAMHNAFIDDLLDPTTPKSQREQAAASEIIRLRCMLVEAHNCWRHEFSEAIDAATDTLFSRLSVSQTDPFGRREDTAETIVRTKK